MSGSDINKRVYQILTNITGSSSKSSRTFTLIVSGILGCTLSSILARVGVAWVGWREKVNNGSYVCLSKDE